MDKNAIKKYAVWARVELIDRVRQRAQIYGITEKDTGDPGSDTVNGHLLSQTEKRQRAALIQRIRQKGYQQVMEEAAYTWFNRFAALRFMEVNGYLPSHVRVFTNDDGAFKPQILDEAIHLELEGLDMGKVYEMKDANQTEELYKYLLIVQCNALNSILPGLFQKLEDYTELLLPDFLLRSGSVLEQMVTLIPETDWTDQVQIIGWLYQYYNSEPKDKVFADLKKNIKISKEKIPAATQLFTPDWIVRYMVENSLGRLWVKGHPNDELKSQWKYYLEEAEQEPAVQTQLAEIRKGYTAIKPEDILCIDPCQGSGHILCVLFDTLVQIYEAYGIPAREAVASIVSKNLWGLDIDDRASQLAYFSVMMKARQYDRRWFSRHIEPNVFAIQDAPAWTAYEHALRETFARHNTLAAEACIATAKKLFDCFADAKEYGSILQPELTLDDLTFLSNGLDDLVRSADLLDMAQQANVWSLVEAMKPLLRQAQALVQKYHVVVTNPPYMGANGMSESLSTFVKKYYPIGKDDLFSCFIERIIPWLNFGGYCGLMTSYTWMFLTGAVGLRDYILSNTHINSLIQPEYHAFFQDANVPICTFVLGKLKLDYSGQYIRLNDFYGSEIQEKKALEAMHNPACLWRYKIQQRMFAKIPGKPLAYWLPQKSIDLFVTNPLLSSIADMKQGLITGDNDHFLRSWFECPKDNITTTLGDKKKWFFYHKGGEYRKWYGNIGLVVNWENDGSEIINFRDERGKQRSRPQNIQYYFKEGFTWTALTVADFNVRYMPEGAIFDAKGSSGFALDVAQLKYLIGLCNSKVAMEFLAFLAPTMDYSAGAVGKIPIIVEKLESVSVFVEKSISLSRSDWDSFETSWDFLRHPLIEYKQVEERESATTTATPFGEELVPTIETCILLETAYREWARIADQRFQKLKANEEELNRIFIDIYGLQDELTPEVADKDVTVRRADLKRDIRSLISYAVGCMLGRYSLDRPGLQFAGGDWKAYAAQSANDSYRPDKDGILPITEDEYFDDDIVAMFVEWVKTVYGADTLEENLQFIASALGGTGSARQVIRQYFLSDFFKDHCATYSVTGSGKRPIYWLFDSGKKNGFKALVYMHRWQPDTIARVRTDYVHETQSRYRTAMADLERQIENATGSQRVKLNKELTALQAKADELRAYEEKIHHLADQMIGIDLDDGVKVNYAKFAEVLAAIK